jgi:hypothetical protein
MKIVTPDFSNVTYSRNFKGWRDMSILMYGKNEKFRDVYSLLINNWPNASLVLTENNLRKEIKIAPPSIAIAFAEEIDTTYFDIFRMDLSAAKAKIVVKFDSQKHIDSFDFRRKLTLSNATLCQLSDDIFKATDQLSELLLDLAQAGVAESDSDMTTIRAAFQGFVDGLRSAGINWSENKAKIFEKAAKHLLSLYALDFRVLQAANTLIETYDYWKAPFSKNEAVESAFMALTQRVNKSGLNFKLVTEMAIFARDFLRNGNFPPEQLWMKKLNDLQAGPRSESLFGNQYPEMKRQLLEFCEEKSMDDGESNSPVKDDQAS